MRDSSLYARGRTYTRIRLVIQRRHCVGLSGIVMGTLSPFHVDANAERRGRQGNHGWPLIRTWGNRQAEDKGYHDSDPQIQEVPITIAEELTSQHARRVLRIDFEPRRGTQQGLAAGPTPHIMQSDGNQAAMPRDCQVTGEPARRVSSYNTEHHAAQPVNWRWRVIM